MADGVYEIEEIIGRRLTGTGEQEYLVHWKKYRTWQSTWEPLENLRDCLSNVADFMYKAYPIPGLIATEILHLKPKAPGIPLQPKLQNITQMNRKKLRGFAHKEIRDEIMREKGKELELKKERGRGRGRKRMSQPEVVRYVLRNDDGSIFNGQTLDKTLNCVPSPVGKQPKKRKRLDSTLCDNNHKLSATRKSKDKALLAMASANVNNNFDWFSIDKELVDRTVRTTRTHGELDECVSITREGTIMKLSLCNEEKKNALTIEMCEQFAAALHEAAKDDVNVVVITGAGKYFCSGLDYSCIFNNRKGGHHKHFAKLVVEKFKLLVEVIINFPKPLVAAVNGNAVGFGTSLLALCDIVYVCSEVILEMSFTKWGHAPIGCSTYTLPRILGQTGACALLLFSGQLTATEAWENGLAIQMFNKESFTKETAKRVKSLASLPTKCIQDTKSLLQQSNQQTLKNTNSEECKMLLKYLTDDQGIASMAKIWQADVVG